MNCPKCGAQCSENQLFCNNCGNKLAQQNPAPAENEEKTVFIPSEAPQQPQQQAPQQPRYQAPQQPQYQAPQQPQYQAPQQPQYQAPQQPQYQAPEQPVSAPVQPEKKKNNAALIIIIVVAALLLLGGAYVILDGFDIITTPDFFSFVSDEKDEDEDEDDSDTTDEPTVTGETQEATTEAPESTTAPKADWETLVDEYLELYEDYCKLYLEYYYIESYDDLPSSAQDEYDEITEKLEELGEEIQAIMDEMEENGDDTYLDIEELIEDGVSELNEKYEALVEEKKEDEGKATVDSEAAEKVAEYVAANGDAFLEEFAAGFEASGMTCTSSIEAVDCGIVIDININEFENVSDEQKATMQSVYDSSASTFETALSALQAEVPELEYMIINVCDKNGELLAKINVGE